MQEQLCLGSLLQSPVNLSSHLGAGGQWGVAEKPAPIPREQAAGNPKRATLCLTLCSACPLQLSQVVPQAAAASVGKSPSPLTASAVQTVTAPPYCLSFPLQGEVVLILQGLPGQSKSPGWGGSFHRLRD